MIRSISNNLLRTMEMVMESGRVKNKKMPNNLEVILKIIPVKFAP